MSEQNNLICREFENELWLYVEKELPKEKIELWNDHLNQCMSCSTLLKNEMSLIENLTDELSEDVLDSKFEMMINKTVSQKERFSIKSFWGKTKDVSFAGKVAVISSLAVVAIVVSLVSPRQSPVKTVSHELLDWEGNAINTQIELLHEQVKSLNENSWNSSIEELDKQIQVLEIQTDKF